MGTSIDNLELDPKTGDIWVGAHPKMHNFTASVFDPSLPAPSQVNMQVYFVLFWLIVCLCICLVCMSVCLFAFVVLTA